MSRSRPSARHSVRADDDGVGGTTIYQLHTHSRSTRIESSRQGALAAAQTLFDRDLWPRDESPTPESSARVRFE